MKTEITEKGIEEALCRKHSRSAFEKLNRGKVAVAGLGGLGSNITIALARLGVGHLHLIDYDRVELANLNRQQYFLGQIGSYKTDAMREILLEINPYLEIIADCVRVTEENLPMLFEKEEIICEAFDDPEQKAMLVNGILTCFPEKKLVAASGMAGYGRSNEIHTRQIAKNFYLCGDEKTEPQEGMGLTAPRAALCAAHQANLAAALLLAGTAAG